MSPKPSLDDDATQQSYVTGARFSIRIAAALLALLIAGGPSGSLATDQGPAGASKEPPAASHQKESQKEKDSHKEKDSQKEGEGKASSSGSTDKRPASGEGSAPAAPPPPEQPEEPAKKALGSVILTAKLALMADPRLFPYEIEVEIDGARAVLSGKVASAEEQLAATEVVQTVPSIKEVVNKLVATPDVKAALAKHADDLITQYVKDRFARSETLKTSGFEVTCQNGIVSLKGETRFQVIALEAAQAARQVPGVKAVNTAGVHLAGTIIKEKEPEKEPPKEPAKEPAKESGKESAKEPAKEQKEPVKEPKKEPAKTKEKDQDKE
ncbi:MAG TPA: BON domain-containing protein [Nitrospiraceae bacterium]|nr:BON domain-containing protein [Nitrospiraceae bacterium]